MEKVNSKSKGLVCPSCLVVFIPHDHRQKCCSKPCGEVQRKIRRKVSGNYGHKQRGPFSCETCRKEFFDKKSTTHKSPKFCSVRCRHLSVTISRIGRYSPIDHYTCMSCGSNFYSRRRKRLCGRCLPKKQSFQWSKILLGNQYAICPVCSVSFSRVYGFKSSMCSDACTAEANRIQNRKQKSKRRAVIRSAPVRELFDPYEIFERDGWSCRGCLRELSSSDRGTYKDEAPELDHIIPLSKGGCHTRDNTQLLCRSCNIRKGSYWSGEGAESIPVPFL